MNSMLLVLLWGMFLGSILSDFFGTANSGKEYTEIGYRARVKAHGMFTILLFVISVIFSIMKIFGVS